MDEPMTEKPYSDDVALIGASKAINELIVNENFGQALDNVTKILGVAFDSDCGISRIHITSDGHTSLILEHYWLKIHDDNRINQNINLRETPFKEILLSLEQGKIFTFKFSEANEELKKHLTKTGGKSGVLIPILVDQKLWGILSMADIRFERDWGAAMVSMLESLGGAISNTIRKKHQQEKLESELSEKSRKILFRNRQILALIGNVPGIVFRCRNDENWSMLYISEYAEVLTGYLPSEFMAPSGGFSFSQIIFPNDREFVQEEVSNQLEEGNKYQITYRINHAKGEVRWLWEQGILRKEEEEILEGVMMDITDKVKAQERVLSATLETEERERSRISREIHDNLQQLLTTAHLNLQSVKSHTQLETDTQKKFDVAFDYLQQGIEESRRLSHKLMPKAIEDYGYQMAVTSMLEGLEGTSEIKFHYQDNLNDQRLPLSMELCLYRITQEAITNVIKFSHATEATVQLIRHKKSLLLTIEDDGVGFDKTELNNFKGSFGMNSMINRATSIGGQLFVDTSPGRGTQLTIDIPITKLVNDPKNTNPTRR